VRKIGLVTLVVLSLPLSLAAYADTVQLPTPEAARVQSDDLIRAVGGRPDRLLASTVSSLMTRPSRPAAGVERPRPGHQRRDGRRRPGR
jgi:hypothetical protein